ncbi:hypothetical protein, partial [Vibrio cholerae]|uniref:hypothetical protein n=1 Tax=Vibrio cholerae TaxID=666 RepID=UPI001955237B
CLILAFCISFQQVKNATYTDIFTLSCCRTNFPLRSKFAAECGVLLTPKSGLYSLKVGMSAIGT